MDPFDERNLPMTFDLGENSNASSSTHILADYSDLFGEEFQIIDCSWDWDSSYLNILDIGAVEEGIFHILYACASQVFMCIMHTMTKLISCLLSPCLVTNCLI